MGAEPGKTSWREASLHCVLLDRRNKTKQSREKALWAERVTEAKQKQREGAVLGTASELPLPKAKCTLNHEEGQAMEKVKFEEKAAAHDGGVDCAMFFVVSDVVSKEQSTLHRKSPESCGLCWAV